ncbi:response regulator transcription factor [Litchfieldia alkalitelluris]|uniref:response regulator transcription factor n=1 Tax=Litchfieldia alkalitelluris TaxID=304268 RepID=UPI000997D9C5|nr:response regulator transcription factor [Litchfieldia alkalitelluris]
MFKVILVDDEQFVRKGLMSLIDWEQCGFEVVGDASNGEDALLLIKESVPDLVITDIRMPVLDGLELIQHVIERKEATNKFIIVSGFNDFKYAQRALRYGVTDFILKPIDKEEMESTLVTLAEALRKEKQKEEIQRNFQVDAIFEEILLGVDTPELTLSHRKILRVDHAVEFYYYLLIEVNGLHPNEIERLEMIKQDLVHVFTEFCQTKEQVYFYKQKEGVYGVVVTSNDLKRYQNNVERFLDRLNEAFKKKVKEETTLYLGKAVTSVTELRTAYSTAKLAMQYKYSNSNNHHIIYDEVKDHQVKYAEIKSSLFQKLMELLEENHTEQLCSAIDDIFVEFETKVFAPGSVSTSINRCIHSVVGKIREFEGDETALNTLEDMIEWQTFQWTTPELKQRFKEFMIEAAQLLGQVRKQTAKGDIYKIKMYIDQNFRENLSLKSIANTFFMNPVYMGQLFKKTYGVYFKEYLLALRLNEAKKQLRQTHKRVYEIAEEVGFGSTDYFVTQFEKNEKITPTEYRNQILES